MSRPTILVTNDDGIVAPGIRALIEVASKHGDVVVVAPDSPQSGQGHAITIETPLRLNRVQLYEDIEAYECTGTPVDCVKLAKNVVCKDKNIDLCVSGINHGTNASINIIYSGTMSAAMEASIERIPSIGFSFLDYSFDADFDMCQSYADKLIGHTLQNGLGGAHLLNVNFPILKKEEVKGFRICRQAEGNWKEEFLEATDPRGRKYYWMTGEFLQKTNDQDTDLWALQNGYISVVPSKHDLTHHRAIPTIKSVEFL